MTQIDVTLTNFILFIESVTFAFFVSREKNEMKTPCLIIFLSLGSAALLGGLHHGFGSYLPVAINSFIWWLTLLLIGINAYGFALIGLALLVPSKVQVFHKSLLFLLGIYILSIIFQRSYLMAIIFYLPSVFLTIAGFYAVYRKYPDGQIKIGIYGLGLSLLASVIQQLEINIHPVYFTYNALYHVMLMIALYMFYVGLQVIPKLNVYAE